VSRWVLRTDGGARGNPGPAGAGFVLETPDGDISCRGGRYLGHTTNNVAEYQAVLWGLHTAVSRSAVPLTVYSDSELLVKQLNGQYRVKNEGLKPLFAEAQSLIRTLGDVRVVHVRREQNSSADGLANEAMDARGVVGDAPLPGDGGQGTLFG
jgi:ribonuclease HI